MNLGLYRLYGEDGICVELFLTPEQALQIRRVFNDSRLDYRLVLRVNACRRAL